MIVSPSSRARSPPTREAWIEMLLSRFMTQAKASPPTREAWIEICGHTEMKELFGVASHPGGVD